MKKVIAMLLAVLLMVSLCACTGGGETGEQLGLWFISKDGGGGISGLTTEPYTGPATVPALMEALLAGPRSSGMISTIPAGTGLWDWGQSAGVVWVDLSRSYLDLSGVDLTLADYCITLTLTQLEGVGAVRITVNGADRPLRERPLLRAEDVLFSGAEEEPVELIAALHFHRQGGNELGVEQRIFRLIESESATLAVLEALLAGPQEPGLVALLPPETEIYSARVEGGVCYADFSAAFLEQIPPTPEKQRMVLQSITDSLCSLGYVRAVQILVEGEPLTVYGSVDVNEMQSAE